jgi:hypothetical protein
MNDPTTHLDPAAVGVLRGQRALSSNALDVAWARVRSLPSQILNAPQGADRRRSPRAEIRIPVSVELDDYRVPKALITANVSLTGMFVAMRHPPPIGSRVKFAIQLEEGIVRGIADVVHIRLRSQSLADPSGMGLDYRCLLGAGKEQLARALASALVSK